METHSKAKQKEAQTEEDGRENKRGVKEYSSGIKGKVLT